MFDEVDEQKRAFLKQDSKWFKPAKLLCNELTILATIGST
jgi:hypothetical protein